VVRSASMRNRVCYAVDCPSIATKHVTPHTLRHSAAMALLHAGVDTSVIALWLGHEDPGSTQAYLRPGVGRRVLMLPKLRGVLPTLARHTDNLPAGPAVRCPPSGVNPTGRPSPGSVEASR
jgi:hypothetical protein